jgi:hypothetical protein
MKILNRKIVLVFLYLFFLGLSPINAELERNIERLVYTDSMKIEPNNIQYYHRSANPCRFYNFRMKHPRRCGYWYDGPHYGPYYGLGIPWFKQHHRPHYWKKHHHRWGPHRGGHHYKRHHCRHHR